ncbi:uncharacterized protein RSE6_09257 [Rhynchosporium secalis]|uniref:Core Histone H2A/H2B/H3 domain-containing protein n=1 Tax=Rhynchosporium secalis TaxID=38038 RepID=A0A1E1MHI2_RHYSE|nr:uncharacterized protein RSE6_09257 [Rhynchosporium secalis]
MEFEITNLYAIYAKRVTIQSKDIKLVRRLRGIIGSSLIVDKDILSIPAYRSRGKIVPAPAPAPAPKKAKK